jgi:SAM-dependent methyltransferase
MTLALDAPPPLTPMGCLRFDVVSRWLDQLRPATVLEVGCGQGAVGARLARTARYVGVEPDGSSYTVAHERVAAAGGTVIHGDDTAVPDGAQYDLVCAFEVLEHIEDDTAALERWQRLIKPGGHLMLSVPAWPSRFGPMDELVGHFRRYTPDQLRAQLVGAGLSNPRLTLYGWPLGYLLESVRNSLARRRRQASEDSSIAERTATSGRMLQPKKLAGTAVRLGVVPFQYVQRLAPTRGAGLVAIAQQPLAHQNQAPS